MSTRIALLSLILLITQMLSARAEDPDPLKDYGAEVKGLRTKVTLVKATIETGKPVSVHYVKRNVSKETLKVWHSGFWPNHQIAVKDADGQEPALTKQGAHCKKAFNPGGARDKNFPVELKPDTEDATEGNSDLTLYFDLTKPGKYSVEIIYEEKQGGWEGRVVSNTAAFEITK